MSRYYTIISILITLAVVYLLGSGVYISNTTGLLVFTAGDKNATISIDQPGHKISNLGIGSRRVRLAPGDYEILASNGRSQTIKSVSIQKKQTYNLSISPTQDLNPKSKYNSEANDLIDKYLPFTERHSAYRVSYLYQPGGGVNQPIIVITAPNPTNQQAALKWISSLGYDTSHFVINFETAPPN